MAQTESRCEADHSFGDAIMFWDALFGTRYLPTWIAAPVEAGFEGVETYPTTWWGEQLAPFRGVGRGRVEGRTRK